MHAGSDRLRGQARVPAACSAIPGESVGYTRWISVPWRASSHATIPCTWLCKLAFGCRRQTEAMAPVQKSLHAWLKCHLLAVCSI